MWLFIKRFILRTLMFFGICVPIMLLGSIILLLFLPFSKHEKLPYFLKWWDCADFYVGRDPHTYREVVKKGWWARYTWLAWRNPMNYFEYRYMGMEYDPRSVWVLYDPQGDDVGDKSRAGYRHIELTDSKGRGFYEYYWIYKYPFASNWCFRFRMGWKIKDKKRVHYQLIQWCFVIGPWFPYSGA